MNTLTNAAARQLARLLARHSRQLVLAESCTGGLVAATLAGIPGISAYLCGSAVTYQTATKHAWLDIPSTLLERPGPVSRVVAEQMAERVLERTPQANLAAAVTGHLGPHAPKRFDGLVFIAIAERAATGEAVTRRCERLLLRKKSRGARQQEAAQAVLVFLREWLATIPD